MNEQFDSLTIASEALDRLSESGATSLHQFPKEILEVLADHGFLSTTQMGGGDDE